MPENAPSANTERALRSRRAAMPGIGSGSFQPVMVARPSASIRAPPMRKIHVWRSMMTWVSQDAPKAIGRMITAMPSANTSVIAASERRRWKLVAKYARSITEMQHGAKRATTPPRKAAITVVPKRISLMSLGPVDR